MLRDADQVSQKRLNWQIPCGFKPLTFVSCNNALEKEGAMAVTSMNKKRIR